MQQDGQQPRKANDRDAAAIVLITRVRTNNQGNQALSAAWQRAIVDSLPGHPVHLLERSPPFLRDYRPDTFDGPDPEAAFDAVAGRLAAIPPAAPDPASSHVTLDLGITATRPFAALRKRIRPRRLTAVLGLSRRAYRRRLGAFADARLVVMNPAGEFYPGAAEVALSYLLDLRVAQLLGCRTAVVNLSLETTHPIVNRLARHVLDACDLLEFREERSRDAYRALGGRAEPLILPDLAVLTPSPPPVAQPAGVAIAINGLQVERLDLEAGWVDLIRRVQVAGRPVTLVTNEWPTDIALFERLAAQTGATIDPSGLDYDAFCARLGAFETVVTSRLHTAILALAAGRPVVAIEPGSFKMAACLAEIDAPEPVRYDMPDWADRIAARIAGPNPPAANGIARARTRIAAELPPALRAAYGDG